MQKNQGSQKTRGYKPSRQKIMDQEFTQIKVDVGVLKTQVTNITALCDKMDKVIDRLMASQEKIVNEIYNDMDKEKEDTNTNMKELHSRITTVDRNLSDKLELTERRIMDEIKLLRDTISEHNKEEDDKLAKILEWKWMAAGGILVLAWLFSHIKFDIITKLLN